MEETAELQKLYLDDAVKGSGLGWNYEKIAHIGKIRYETYLPTMHGSTVTAIDAMRYTPIDPSAFEANKRRQLLIDSDEWWNRKDDRGECGLIFLFFGSLPKKPGHLGEEVLI